MANENRISVVITADPAGAVTGIRMVGDETEKLGGRTQSLTQRLKSHWAEATVAVYAAARAFQEVWDYADKAAKVEQAMSSLDALTRQYGTTAEELTGRISEASRGLIDMHDSARIAGEGILKGLGPDQLTQMASWAVSLSHIKGGAVSAAEAFEMLSQSIATGRERGLKALVGIVDLEEKYGKYAATMSKAEKAQAMLAIVSERMGQVQATLGTETDSAADKMTRFKNQVEDLKISVGDFTLRLGAAMFGVFQSIAGSISIIIGGILKLFEASSWITDKVGLTKGAAAQWKELSDALRMSGEDLKQKAQQNYDLAIKGKGGSRIGRWRPAPGRRRWVKEEDGGAAVNLSEIHRGEGRPFGQRVRPGTCPRRGVEDRPNKDS